MSPQFLEKKLEKEYGAKNKGAIYGTMNKIGAMKGRKETKKGKEMEKKYKHHKVSSSDGYLTSKHKK